MAFLTFHSIASTAGAASTSCTARQYVLDKMADADIVFMGTTHKQPAILGMIAGLLPRLSGAGVTHLALEIASDQQDVIDGYLAGDGGLDRLVLHSALDCPQYRHLLEVLAALPAERRPRVRAVDLPPDLYGNGINRDQWMAGQLLAIFQSREDAKVLAVMGSLHVLRELPWLPRIADPCPSIRNRLRARRPDLRFFSIVNIIPGAEPDCDFGRMLGSLPGIQAFDLDRRFQGWTLGLTRCIAIAPAEPYELVDGVIVY